MTDTAFETPGRANGAARQDRADNASRRVAELEAENAALRRALARAGIDAERAADRHGGELGAERAGRAADAAEARSEALGVEARHGRGMAAGRADLAASEANNDALRRANAELAASRAALREREERLRLILDSAADYAIVGMDLDRRVSSWNAGAERLLGWTEGEIAGRSADAIFTPEDREAGAPEREAGGALRDGRAADDRWHARKDGSRFWGSGLVMPLRDPAAGPGAPPLGLLKVMRDDTERRRAEEALRARERRLRLLADAAAGLLAAADPEEVMGPVLRGLSEEFGVDISFSHVADGEGSGGGGGLRLVSCFGVPDEARAGSARLAPGEGVCGQAARDLRPVHVADARASGNPRCAPLRALGVRAYAAYPLVAGDGRLLGTISFGSRARARFSAEESAFLGTIAHHVAVLRERLRAEAALRESEARFRALARASSEVLYRMSPDWAEMRQLSGGGFLTDAPEPTRGWLEDYIHPDDWPVVKAAYEDAIRRRGVLELEHRVRRPDGSLGWTHSRAVPILGADGEITEWFGAASDVTARREAKEALRESEARQGFLLRLGDALRPLHDAAEIQATACRLVGEHLGAAQVGFGEVDAAQERVTVRRAWNDGRVPSVVGTWRMDDFGPAFTAGMKRGETAAIPDIARDPRTDAPAVAAACAGIGARAILDVPLVKGGRMVAMLFIHHPEPRPWSASEVEAAKEACARLWDAVERARAEAALRGSEGRRRAALDAARLGTWEWDTATGALALDGRSREIFGFAPGEGVCEREVFGRIHPDDRPRVHAESMAAAGAKSRLEVEYRVCLPDGGERAVASLGDVLPGRDGGPARMAGVFADTTERRRAEERRALLVNELNHRVKNTLAVVQSLTLQTARGAPDLPAFTAAFQARLIALARAHDLLTRKDWEGAALADVARAALEPSTGAGDGRVDLGACASDALLAPAQALAVAMALHELATNAAKHGALSVPGGRVSVGCRADPGNGARVVEWVERGGPPIAAPPARKGFGLRLLERGLATQAGMETDLRFEPEGLRCALRLPPAR